MPTLHSPTSQPGPRDVGHLGDFTAGPRMLVIAALAVPVGVASALVAWALLRLIGLITNAVFYARWGTRLVAPGAGHHNPAVLLLAPIVGGLVIGVVMRASCAMIMSRLRKELRESCREDGGGGARRPGVRHRRGNGAVAELLLRT